MITIDSKEIAREEAMVEKVRLRYKKMREAKEANEEAMVEKIRQKWKDRREANEAREEIMVERVRLRCKEMRKDKLPVADISKNKCLQGG